MRVVSRILFVLFAIFCAFAIGAPPEFGSNPIGPKAAREQVGKRVTVQISVLSTAENEAHVHRLFSGDPKSPSLVVIIPETALGEFRKVNIDNPATFYKGKTILVVGQVKMPKDRAVITVTSPDEIKVVADSSGRVEQTKKRK